MAHFSKTVSAGSRIYYFDLRRDTNGQSYVTITEMNKRTGDRNTIFLHHEDFDKFCKALIETVINYGKTN